MAANGNGNTLAGIRMILEEIRDLRREGNEDRKRADEDRKRADEDRKRASEERKRFEERLIRVEEKQDQTLARLDKSLVAVAGALENLTVAICLLQDTTNGIAKTLKEHTGLLHDIRDAVRKPGRNGHGKK